MALVEEYAGVDEVIRTRHSFCPLAHVITDPIRGAVKSRRGLPKSRPRAGSHLGGVEFGVKGFFGRKHFQMGESIAMLRFPRDLVPSPHDNSLKTHLSTERNSTQSLTIDHLASPARFDVITTTIRPNFNDRKNP